MRFHIETFVLKFRRGSLDRAQGYLTIKTKIVPVHLVSWDVCTGIVPLLLEKYFLLRG